MTRTTPTHAHADDGFDFSLTDKSLPIALLRTREKVMERFRPVLQRHGVTEQQWRVLRVLDEAPGIDMGALAEASNILSPSLSRMTRALHDRGLIDTARAPGDGRRARLQLTAKGQALIARVAPESAAIRAEIDALVGADRIAALLDHLDAVQRALSPKA